MSDTTTATAATTATTAVIEQLAARCATLARRAQPHTVASRLTLADHGQVLQALQNVTRAAAAGALAMAGALPRDAYDPGERIAIQVDRAACYLLDAIAAAGRLLRAPGCAPAQRSLAPGRRPLVSAAKSAAATAADFGTLSGEKFPGDAGARWYELLGEIITDLESACSYEATLVDACAQQAGIPSGHGAAGHLISAMTELRRARHHLHLIGIVLRDAAPDHPEAAAARALRVTRDENAPDPARPWRWAGENGAFGYEATGDAAAAAGRGYTRGRSHGAVDITDAARLRTERSHLIGVLAAVEECLRDLGHDQYRTV